MVPLSHRALRGLSKVTVTPVEYSTWKYCQLWLKYNYREKLVCYTLILLNIFT